MELFIQMGHNMQALALEHLEEFDGGTIIISPMNILPNKVKGYATRVHKKKGKVLINDPLSGLVWRKASSFERIYNKMGKMAVVIQ